MPDGRPKRILYLNLTKSPSHNLLSRYQIVMKSCTECISITVMCCVKFRNGSTNDMDDMEESDGARFEFDPSFGLISCIATVPDVRQCIHLNRSCSLENYIA